MIGHNPVDRLPLPALVKFSVGSAWRLSGRLLLLCTVAALAVATFVGVGSAMSTVATTRGDWYREGRVADLEVRFDEQPVSATESLRHVPGVEDALGRRITTGSTTVGDDEQTLAIILEETPAATSDTAVDRLVLLEGSLVSPDDSRGALVGAEMARYHGVAVGDRLEVRSGDTSRTITVRGIVRDAEHLISPLNPSLFVSAKGSMGMVYVAPESSGTVNSVALSLRQGASADVVRDQVLEAAGSAGLLHPYVLGGDEQFDYQYVEKNLDVFRIILPVLVAVGALAATFVSLFLSAQWVARSRQEIAVLQALGYSRGAVAAAFTVPYLLLVVVTITGGLLGAVLVGQGFLNTFAETVGLPAIRLTMDPLHAVLGSLGVVVVLAAGAGLAFRHIYAMSPREAMSAERPTAASTRGSRIGQGIAWTALRLAVGNVTRTPWVSAASVVAIATGIGLTAAFFLSYSAVMSTSLSAVERNTWDVMVDFRQPLTDEQATNVLEENGADRWTPVVKAVTQARSGDEKENLLVGGFDPATTWHRAQIISGEDISSGKPDGVVLESGTARSLDLAPGDHFELVTGGRSVSVELVGTMSSALPGEARMPIALARDVSGQSGVSTGAMVELAPGQSASDVSAALDRDDKVQQALTKEEISRLVVQSSDQVTALLWMGALMGIAVAVLLVSACLGYTVFRRRGEYRLISMLGHSDRTVRSIVVLEASILGTAAIALALPVALLVSRYLNGRLSDAWFHIDSAVAAAPLLQTLVPSLVLLPMLALLLAHLVFPRGRLVAQARTIG